MGLFLSLFTGAAGEVVFESRSSDFLISKWTTEDGLPQNTVTSIIQSRDGYLWLGTFGGLARFDGIRFKIYDSVNSPDFTENRVTGLMQDSKDRIWVGTQFGMTYILENDRFEAVPAAPGFNRQNVQGLAEDADGNIFIASTFGTEVVLPRTRVSTVVSPLGYAPLLRAPDGSVWGRYENGIGKFSPTGVVPASELGFNEPDEVHRFDFVAPDRILFGGYRMLGVLENTGFVKYRTLDPTKHLAGYSLRADGKRMLIQQINELLEIDESSFRRHDLSGYVEGGSRAILVDSDKNIWLATQSDGLVRLTRRTIERVGDWTDIPMVNNYVLTETDGGTVWIGGIDLLRVEGRKVTKVTRVQGARFPVVRALARGPNGELWVGGINGLFRLSNDTLIPVPEFAESSIQALLFDRDGGLWVGDRNGATRLFEGQKVQYSTSNGLIGNQVHHISQTSDGSVWFGTTKGLSRFRNGAFENYGSDQGLSGDFVRDVVEDKDGTIWIGTYGGGINRLREGHLKAITTANGLSNNFVSRILIDRFDGRFWILTNFGILAVSLGELNDVADGTKPTLIGSTYGVGDGMRSSEANGGSQPAGMMASDGRLWFPMIKDVVVIDPKLADPVPPKVIIESAIVPGRGNVLTSDTTSDGDRIYKLSADEKYLEIQYTGFSFRKPEAVRFFYKLEGLDDDWIDAGSRRSAFYPYLPAGTYRFRVSAANADGVMSENAAVVTIEVAQRFWETRWFRYLILLFVSLIVVGVFFLRLRALDARQRQVREFSRKLIDAHENERRRIAKELHDGLGHQLMLIKNWALLGRQRLKRDPETAELLDRITETAAGSIDETRAIVHNLSPQNLRRFGVTSAIRGLIDDTSESTDIEFVSNIDDIDGIFSEESELSLVRILQESISNVVRHSGCTRCEIEIRRTGSGPVAISVRDDGNGISAESGKRTGFGLQSIEQRVSFLGGRLSIASEPGRGTEVSIVLPV